MLSEVCYQQIEGDFYYGWYGGFNVVMMKSNGYVNATKLCADGGRRFQHWKDNNHVRDLIQEFESQPIRNKAAFPALFPIGQEDF